MEISRDLTCISLWQFSVFGARSAAAKLLKGKAPRKPCNLQDKVSVCHSPPTPDKIRAQRAPQGGPALPRPAADPKPGRQLGRNPVSSAVNALKRCKKYPKQLCHARGLRSKAVISPFFFFFWAPAPGGFQNVPTACGFSARPSEHQDAVERAVLFWDEGPHPSRGRSKSHPWSGSCWLEPPSPVEALLVVPRAVAAGPAAATGP